MRIWFIGLGLMGIPMAKNILTKWGDLSVWNRTPKRADELVKYGAKFRNSIKELAEQVDVLITMVTAWQDVHEVLFGEGWAVEWLRPGSIVVDMSTIWVEWAVRISAELQSKGIHFLDAPVTGSTPKAITGELTLFIWGELKEYQIVKPVLAMMGTNIQYMGSVGSGQAMKLVNNTLVAYSMIGLSEVMKLSKTLGLSLTRTAEVIKTLPVSSPYIAMKVNNFVRDDFTMMFSLANMKKDINLAHDAMKQGWESLPMLDLAKESYDRGVDAGLGGMDVSAIGKL